MIAALTDMISASTEESAPGEVATSAAELKEDQTELRCLRIQQLEALQLNYDTYALVNPDKFISDWEVYINLMGAVEVEVGEKSIYRKKHFVCFLFSCIEYFLTVVFSYIGGQECKHF